MTIIYWAAGAAGVGATAGLWRHLPVLGRRVVARVARDGRDTAMELAAAVVQDLLVTDPADGAGWVLELERSHDWERAVALHGEVVAGRGLLADLRLHAPGVSRRHARFAVDGDGIVRVTDLGSTNGLFVGGRKVLDAVLRDGDLIGLGRTVVLRLVRVT